MVDVADRRVAIGGGASVPVAGPDERLQHPVECPAPGVAADDDPVAGEQPAQGLLSGGRGQQFSRDVAGDRTVAGDLGRERAGRVEQGLDRHHDLHLDGHVAGGGLPGEPFDEGVGEDLPAAADDGGGGDVVGVDRPVQRAVAARNGP